MTLDLVRIFSNVTIWVQESDEDSISYVWCNTKHESCHVVKIETLCQWDCLIRCGSHDDMPWTRQLPRLRDVLLTLHGAHLYLQAFGEGYDM
jgi:hypothetical protein